MKKLLLLFTMLLLVVSCTNNEPIIEEPLLMEKLVLDPFLYTFDNINLEVGQELYIYPTWEDGNPDVALFTFYVKYVIDNTNCKAGTYGSSPYLIDDTQNIRFHSPEQIIIETIGLYGYTPAKYIWTITIDELVDPARLFFDIHAVDADDVWDSTNWLPYSDWTLPFTRSNKAVNSLKICN